MLSAPRYLFAYTFFLPDLQNKSTRAKHISEFSTFCLNYLQQLPCIYCLLEAKQRKSVTMIFPKITAVIAMFADAVVVAMKQRSNLTSLLVIGNYNFRASKTITSLTRGLPENPWQKLLSFVAQNMLVVICCGSDKTCPK